MRPGDANHLLFAPQGVPTLHAVAGPWMRFTGPDAHRD